MSEELLWALYILVGIVIFSPIWLPIVLIVMAIV